MAKLNQIIAIEKGVKSRTYAALTEANKVAQHGDLFNGFTKTYQKLDEETEDLPPEAKRVQVESAKLLESVREVLGEILTITARKDWTNTSAKADVKIRGQVLIEGAPVPYLLFLEKLLTDLRTFVSNIAVLDPSESWSLDANSGLFKTPTIKTHRNKKTQRAIVLYEATEHHPAQTQLITEDVLAGHWNITKFSGALPRPEKEALIRRVNTLLDAVKQAREEANGTEEVDSPNVGDAIFEYLLAS